MNATGSLRDVITMVHEGGHAIHSFVTRDMEITDFKSTPSEVAELASMSMELISMEHWDVFFKNAPILVDQNSPMFFNFFINLQLGKRS